jgi:hypothetical protein
VIGINLQNATEGYTGKCTRVSVGRMSPCIKAFWWFCKADLLAISEQNGSRALAPVFKQTEGEGGGGVGGVAGGRWKLFVVTAFLHV